MEGVKYDHDKPRWDLLPMAPIEEVVEVLTYGAKKYTREGELTWKNLKKIMDCALSVESHLYVITPQVDCAENVIRKTTRLNCEKGSVFNAERGEYTQGICAKTATISGLKKEIQSIEKINELIARNGQNEIKTLLKNIEKITILTLKEEQEDRDKNLREGLTDLDLQKKNITNALRVDVNYADPKSIYILITTTKQGSSEDCYVVNATKLSDCLMMILEFFKKQYNISATVKNGKLIEEGDENWRKVDNQRSRYYAALMRHVVAWWMGERLDPGSKKHHLAHAICCLIFLMEGDRCKQQQD